MVFPVGQQRTQYVCSLTFRYKIQCFVLDSFLFSAYLIYVCWSHIFFRQWLFDVLGCFWFWMFLLRVCFVAWQKEHKMQKTKIHVACWMLNVEC